MVNPQLLGVGRIDNFNLQGSMGVIALYGVITIISYFNELNKAGLLKRGVYAQPLAHYRFDRIRLGRSVDTMIQNNGDIHSLDLEILKIKKEKKPKKSHEHDGEISIKVHLGQNGSYETINNSVVHVYDHKNVKQNFYTSLNLTFKNVSFKTDNFTTLLHLSTLITAVQSKQKEYQKATLVYLYQQQPDASIVRDCLRESSQVKILEVQTAKSRRQWDAMSKHKKKSYDIIYGGLAFGVCESIEKPCYYVTFVAHPLDRLYNLYHLCKTAQLNGMMKGFCTQYKKSSSLKDFIVFQGSGLFQNLMYHAKHCRLVGEDEICLQDSRTSFVFTTKERILHLNHVLEHLDSWLGFIGLIENLHESLELLRNIHGLHLSECFKEKTRVDSLVGSPAWLGHLQSTRKSKYRLPKTQRESLLNDSAIAKSLAPDIAIYNKLSEVYQKQVESKKTLSEYYRYIAEYSTNQRQIIRNMKSEVEAMMKRSTFLKKNKINNISSQPDNPSKSVSEDNINTASQHRNRTNALLNKRVILIHKNKKNHSVPLTANKLHSKRDKSKRKGSTNTKLGITPVSIEGMDPLLYQNFSILEKSMLRSDKKKRIHQHKILHKIK